MYSVFFISHLSKTIFSLCFSAPLPAMVRWVFSDATGHLCFFDCTAGCHVVTPSIRIGACYSRKVKRDPLRPCSALAFSGGWGGYDESEVTFGTVDGGIFAVKSQWPSAADNTLLASEQEVIPSHPENNEDNDDARSASAGIESSRTECNASVDFRFKADEAAVLRYASLDFPILLLQMMGVHTPHLRSLYEESGKGDFAWLARNFPGAEDNQCCRGEESCCHLDSSCLFSSDRELLAVDKGGNCVVFNWAEDASHGTPAEAERRRSFALHEELSCCCSNPLFQHQLAVASPTSASLLSVFDIESCSFSFQAHCPRGPISTTQVVLSCPPAAEDPFCGRDGAETHLPVYADVESPFLLKGTKNLPFTKGPQKTGPRVCTSLCWVPSLGPNVLCAATTDALFLLFDTRVSNFPVYIASTVAKAPSPSSSAPIAASAHLACPIVHVGAQPGLVSGCDPMEAAVLPCWCTCCSSHILKGCHANAPVSPKHCLKADETSKHCCRAQNGGKCVKEGSPMFSGHRGRIVVKPHGSNRIWKDEVKPERDTVPQGLKGAVRSRLRKRVYDDFTYSKPPTKVRTHVSSYFSKWGNGYVHCGIGHAKKDESRTKTTQNPLLNPPQCLPAGEVLSPSFLVTLSADSSSPLTLYPFSSHFDKGLQERTTRFVLTDVVKCWLYAACYVLTASSLAVVLRVKHKLSRLLLKRAKLQLNELLRSIETDNPFSRSGADTVKGCFKTDLTTPSCSSQSGVATETARRRASASDSLINAQLETEKKSLGKVLELHDQTWLPVFCSHVIRLLHSVYPTFSMDEQRIASHTPKLLSKHRDNVLRLLEYASTFCFALSSNAYTPGSSADEKTSCKDTPPDLTQDKLPQQLLSLACREVIKRIHRLLMQKADGNAAILDWLVRQAVQGFVSSLYMAFAFPSHDVQPALLFTVPTMFVQLSVQQQILNSTQSEGTKEYNQCLERLSKHPFYPWKATEVHVQRNCIVRMPISDALFFALADIQNRGRKRSSGNGPAPLPKTVHDDGAMYAKARIVCCDAAGNVFVLKVHRSRLPFVRTSRKYPISQHEGNYTADSCLINKEIPFPMLPSLRKPRDAQCLVASNAVTEDDGAYVGGNLCAVNQGQSHFKKQQGAEVEHEKLSNFSQDREGAKNCKCLCCSVKYHVQLEHNFRAQRSRVADCTMCIHSNGCYALFATGDAFFGLYCIDPKLPPYRSWSNDEIPTVATPMMGIALPPAVLGCKLAPSILPPPLLLSASPLLPSLPVPPSIPPYLVTPRVPADHVREWQSFNVQQRRAANGNFTSTDPAFSVAWDNRMEFSDWLSDDEIVDNQNPVR